MGGKFSPSQALRFVIQKHAASHLHFDVLLEWEGTFRCWAALKGPSLDPKDRHMAIEVEDHPLDYGDFEGVISSGEYGGVQIMPGEHMGDDFMRGDQAVTQIGREPGHCAWTMRACVCVAPVVVKPPGRWNELGKPVERHRARRGKG